MNAKSAIDAVGRVLDTFEEAAVAVSGGIDSLTLATLAGSRMGKRVRMFHSLTASVPREATSRTRALAAEHGWALQVIDADNNMPAEGQPFAYNPVVDYASAYQKLWNAS